MQLFWPQDLASSQRTRATQCNGTTHLVSLRYVSASISDFRALKKADQNVVWIVFVLCFLIASLPTNLVYIGIFFFVDLGFLTVAASYFAEADGHHASAVGLKKTGEVFCFLAGLIGWYLTLHLLIKDSIMELPLGDTSRYIGKQKQSKRKLYSIAALKDDF